MMFIVQLVFLIAEGDEGWMPKSWTTKTFLLWFLLEDYGPVFVGRREKFIILVVTFSLILDH